MFDDEAERDDAPNFTEIVGEARSDDCEVIERIFLITSSEMNYDSIERFPTANCDLKRQFI